MCIRCASRIESSDRAPSPAQGPIKLNANYSSIYAAGSFALLGALLTAVDCSAHFIAHRRSQRSSISDTAPLTASLTADGTPAPPRWRVNVAPANRASESTADWRHMYTGE